MSAIDSIEIAACALQTSATERNHEKSRCRTDPDRHHLHGLTSTPAQADEPNFPIKTLSDEFACPGMHIKRLDEKTAQCLKVKQ